MSTQAVVAAAAPGAPAIAGAGAAGAAGAPAQGGGGGMMNTLTQMMRLFLFYSFIKYMLSSYTSSPTSTPTTVTTPDGRTVTLPPSSLRPAWPDLTHFDIHVYVNDDPHFSPDPLFSSSLSSSLPYLSSHLLFHEADIPFQAETWDSPAIRSLNLSLTSPFLPLALGNHSLFAHIHFSRAGYPHSPTLNCSEVPLMLGLVSPCHLPYHPLYAFHTTQQLNLYKPPPKLDKRKNLLTGDRADGSNDTADALSLAPVEGGEVKWVSYWRPTLHIRLVHDHTVYGSLAQLPAEVKDAFMVDAATSTYYPVVYLDYWWLLSSSHLAINDTLTELPLLVTYSPMSFFKYRTELSMDASWKLQEQMGTHSQAETESLKRILLDSNPYLLALTMVVSLFHMLFDFLAFKNDVTFWRNAKSTAGLSGRTVLLNTGCQLVVLLYLVDNETSWMILMSTAVGVLIECWKIPKLFRVSVDGAWPFLHIDPKEVATDSEGKGVTAQDQLMLLTIKYDREAMRLMAYLLYPLVLCYAVYSLMYNSHKSWYSFILTTLVGSVYTFGFINMVPQLYMNYKLKSVAAMPWRQMSYKFLNTIIDDLFAFVIKMPTLHRLSVFRDDLIFVIFLYQRWIYRTDVNRTNEFGVSGLDLQEMERRKKEQETAGSSPATLPVLPQQPRALPAAVDGEERKEAATAPKIEEVQDEPEGGEQSELRRRKQASSTTAAAAVR